MGNNAIVITTDHPLESLVSSGINVALCRLKMDHVAVLLV